jgi:DNA gyrase subunit A
MSIRFDEDDVRAMGRSARGVRGIDLQDGDTVAGVAAVDTDRHSWVLTVTQNGYGKRSDIDDYRVQSRNGKGLIDIKTGDRNGPVCAMETVGPGDHLVVMSRSGQIMRTPVEDISTVGRNTMGVIVMDLEANDRVACLDVIPREMVTDESEADVDLDADPETATASDD